MQTLTVHLGTGPVYLACDIDSLYDAYAPGTGTPEIGGLTIPQALEIIRELQRMQLIGADVVEVSKPFDSFGTTTLVLPI